MEQQDRNRARAIDIHHHYIPPSLLEEAKHHGQVLGVELSQRKNGEPALSFGGAPPHGLHPDLATLEPRFAMMEKGEIAVAAVEPLTSALGYPLDGERGATWCRLYNEGFCELIRQHPDRFAGIAAAPLQDPRRAAAVLEHAIRDLRLSAVMIGSNVNGKYYNGKEFDPFWAMAQELDVLVIMHPEDVAGSERMGLYGLRTVCGNPADSTLSIGYLAYSGVFDRFPNLRLCLLHGGGFFPFHLGRFDQGYIRSGTSVDASSPPSAYLKNLYFDTLVYRVETLEYLKRMVSSDRLMVGTDYPFTLGDWMAVEKVEALNCPAAERDAILQGNARRLLKM